jgi:hypothetical protein
MTTETNRREFEEWAAKEDYDVRKSKYDPKYYMFISTQSSWEAWQAARERQWMPIESAPKDGYALFWLVPLEPNVFGIDAIAHPIKYGRWASVQKATHWMPIPNPPTSEKI